MKQAKTMTRESEKWLLEVRSRTKDMDKPQGLFFYFDETNNFLKVTLNPSKNNYVNDYSAIEKDFILGGICFRERFDTDSLFDALNLQKNTKELKFKHLSQRRSDFLALISNERVVSFVDWLYKSKGLYIHYALKNNIHFALSELVEVVLKLNTTLQPANIHIKDALYSLAKGNEEDVLEIFSLYGFPRIAAESLYPFMQDLISLFEKSSSGDSKDYELVKYALSMVTEQMRIELFPGREPYCIVPGYSDFYLFRCGTLEGNEWFFDREEEVIKSLKNSRNPELVEKMNFLDSESCRFIQISDCVVGLLSRLFVFLDEQINHPSGMGICNLNNGQRDTLIKFNSVMERSSALSELLSLGIIASSLMKARKNMLKEILRQPIPFDSK